MKQKQTPIINGGKKKEPIILCLNFSYPLGKKLEIRIEKYTQKPIQYTGIGLVFKE